MLRFLIEHLEENENSYDVLNMQSVEGKTPLFCAMLSCDIKIETKMEIVKMLFDTN